MPGEVPEYLIVGWVQKPHGIKGELFVRLDTDRPETVFQPGRVLHLADRDGRPEGGTLTIDRSRPFKDGVLIKTAEHTSWSQAVDDLRGRTLVIPWSEAAPLDEDEVFVHQLLGLRVLAGDDTVGTVRELYIAPPGYLLGVERAGAKELLIPFVREMIRRVDVAAGVVEIDAPPGLLEL